MAQLVSCDVSPHAALQAGPAFIAASVPLLIFVAGKVVLFLHEINTNPPSAKAKIMTLFFTMCPPVKPQKMQTKRCNAYNDKLNLT